MVVRGYQQTDIGIIPDDWQIVDFGSTGEFYKGHGVSMSYTTSHGYPCIMYGDIYVNFDIAFEKSVFRLDPSKVADCAKAAPQDLFFTASGETAEEIGKCVSYQGTESIYIGGDIIALRPNANYDSLYLSYVQNSRQLIDQKISFAQGHSVVHISMDSIKRLKFAAPKLKEQQKIAEALRDTDSAIAALEKLIEKKKAIKQGAMQELLTGRRRLCGFSEKWEEKKLEELLEYEQPQRYIVSSTEYCKGITPVLTAGKSFVLGYTNETRGIYKKTPVILFDDFLTVSKYVEFPFKVKSSAIKLLSKKRQDDNLRVIFELMQMIDFPVVEHRRHWISQYSKITIHIPKYREQIAINDVLSSMDNEIEQLSAKKLKLDKVKQGMMENLLTGKIRLV